MSSQPPPKFDLSSVASTCNNDAAAGGLYNAPLSITISPHDVDQPTGSSTVVPFTGHQFVLPDDQVRALRSSQLNRLTATGTGVPTFQVAMDPANFPFVEGARQAMSTNYGVVKLKNVSFQTARVRSSAI
jgi:hypothetical protein